MRCIHDIRIDKECYYCNNGIDKPAPRESKQIVDKFNLTESFDLGDGSGAKVVYEDDYKDLLEAYNDLKWRMEGLEK